MIEEKTILNFKFTLHKGNANGLKINNKCIMDNFSWSNGLDARGLGTTWHQAH
jgi:hypothetical protein